MDSSKALSVCTLPMLANYVSMLSGETFCCRVFGGFCAIPSFLMTYQTLTCPYTRLLLLSMHYWRHSDCLRACSLLYHRLAHSSSEDRIYAFWQPRGMDMEAALKIALVNLEQALSIGLLCWMQALYLSVRQCRCPSLLFCSFNITLSQWSLQVCC